MSSAFSDWVKTAWTNLLSWFGMEEQKLASFLYPIFQELKPLLKQDILHDIADGIPVVLAALSGGIPAALVAAEEYILPLLEKQSVEISKMALDVLKSALVSQAKVAAALPAA